MVVKKVAAVNAAIASTVRHWNGVIDPKCLQRAIALGVTEGQLKKAAKSAVDKDREKRERDKEANRRYEEKQKQGRKQISEVMIIVPKVRMEWIYTSHCDYFCNVPTYLINPSLPLDILSVEVMTALKSLDLSRSYPIYSSESTDYKKFEARHWRYLM